MDEEILHNMVADYNARMSEAIKASGRRVLIATCIVTDDGMVDAMINWKDMSEHDVLKALAVCTRNVVNHYSQPPQ